MSTAVALSTYRHAVQHALDDVETYVVSSAAAGQIASGQLINTSAAVSANRYDRRWCYVWSGAAAGQQRQVVEGSYVATTGPLGVTPPWTTVPLAGSGFELTALFPSIAGTLGATTDYRSLVNAALGLIYVPVTESVTVSGAGRTTLPAATAAWLTRADQLVRFTEPSPVTNRAPVDASWRGIRLVFGAAPALELRAPFTGVLTIEAWRPAATLVNGAASTTGLSADADTALAEVADVTLVGLLLAYQALANRNASRPTGTWAQKYEGQLAVLAAEHAKRMTRGDRSLEPAAAESGQQAAAQATASDALTRVA